MSGRVLRKVMDDERDGKYLGKTVQIIPHVVKAFQERIVATGQDFDVHIVEIGGTVGDYEGLSLIEAIRELGFKVGEHNAVYVHVVYMPYLGASKEVKTKPAQNAVRDLRGFGITPDVLVARSELPAPEGTLEKLSLFSGVSREAIALLPNASSIYEVPLTLEDTGIGDVICKRLNIRSSRPKMKRWRDVVDRATKKCEKKVTVGVVAKYLDNQDTYMSVFEALRSAAWWQDSELEIKWVDAEKLENPRTSVKAAIRGCDGLVVPGGFGVRGLEGKIRAAQYALKNNVPYLGLCLGLQMAVVAAARNGGLKDAITAELEPESSYAVIHMMEGQQEKANTGGTMRLGNYPCKLQSGSLARKLYGQKLVDERHRHRLECNNDFRDRYEKWGIRASGTSPDNHLVEIIEAIDHPFFLASQFHPEFKSRPDRPHPMFQGFVKASLESKN